jgi:hypothetical protein
MTGSQEEDSAISSRQFIDKGEWRVIDTIRTPKEGAGKMSGGNVVSEVDRLKAIIKVEREHIGLLEGMVENFKKKNLQLELTLRMVRAEAEKKKCQTSKS